MGCTNSREEKAAPDLSNQSSELMRQNIELLTVIEYLLLKYRNKPGALKVLEIKKRTEDFYAIISKLRHYWTSKSKNIHMRTLSRGQLLHITSEQYREKEQLLETRNYLKSVLAELEPGWEMKFSSVGEFKNKLETSKELMLKLTEVYFDLIPAGKSNIKKYIGDKGLILDKETREMVRMIKKFTVKLYKNATQRVYFTEDITFTQRSVEVESDFEDISHSISQK
ncbi:hypothetical protein SteCoe_5328 [Stentor coeruleus]|uniref:Uncharacterized protein n=1 Tax=Stentor coeruleus TaxID=5963 RepID=A0A1R2CSN6_9CILI|nr:hypothetical protein SteCoe_5328 [Stentor coeruleus]